MNLFVLYLSELPPNKLGSFCPHRLFCLANTVGYIQPTHRQFWAGPQQPPSLKGTLKETTAPSLILCLVYAVTPSQAPRCTAHRYFIYCYLGVRETCVKLKYYTSIHPPHQVEGSSYEVAINVTFLFHQKDYKKILFSIFVTKIS